MKSRSGLAGSRFFSTSKFDTSRPGTSSPGTARMSIIGCFGIDHAGRRDQRELLDAVPVLAGEFRREIAAERQPDQIEAVELEHVEQLEVVHDVVVHGR